MAKEEDKTAVNPPSAIDKAQDRFSDIATDLFNIEVNTILRDNITAQKMPTPRHALIDIGKMYMKAMEQMEMAYGKNTEAAESIQIDNCYGSFTGFSALREWASRLMKDAYSSKIELGNDQLSILPRIKDNSDLLKGMFTNLAHNHPEIIMLTPEWSWLTNKYSRSDLIYQAPAALPLDEQQLVLIRKVWELGTEIIVMQTIVQIDGDVITRLNSNFLNNPHYPKIRNYHNKGIEIALEHWAGLVTVAKELMVAAGQGIAHLFK